MKTSELAGLIRAQLHGRHFDLYDVEIVASEIVGSSWPDAGLTVTVRQEPHDVETEFEVVVRRVR